VNGRRLDEADLSAESNSPEAKPRFSGQNELAGWSSNLEAPARKGPEATRCRHPLEVAVYKRTGRFERADRLLSSREFQRVGRIGKRVASRYFVVLLAATEKPSESGRRRLGVTVSRRVGNAVKRNRIKRGVRAWFQRSRYELEESLDVVVIARRDAAALSAGEITTTLDAMAVSAERPKR